MPEARQPFESIEVAINLIKSYHREFERPFLDRNPIEIATNLIGGNIARAFHRLPRRPSVVVGEWGRGAVDHLMSELLSVNKQEDYDQLIHHFSNGLVEYWDTTYQIPARRMGYGPATKITNLFVKALHQAGHIRNESIWEFMHVPFDEYTLKPLRFIVNDLANVRYGINIPSTPTMKFVDTPELYDLLQYVSRQLCERSGSLPIVYEYFCWDEQH